MNFKYMREINKLWDNGYLLPMKYFKIMKKKCPSHSVSLLFIYVIKYNKSDIKSEIHCKNAEVFIKKNHYCINDVINLYVTDNKTWGLDC